MAKVKTKRLTPTSAFPLAKGVKVVNQRYNEQYYCPTCKVRSYSCSDAACEHIMWYMVRCHFKDNPEELEDYLAERRVNS